MLCASLLIVFFWTYPLKDLLPGTLTLTKDTLGRVYDNKFMNNYMLFLFIYIMIQFLRGHVKQINNTQQGEKGTKDLSMIISSVKLLPFSIFILLYYLHATSVFYQGLELKVPNNMIGKYIEQGMELSDMLFTRFRICHGYGLFRRMTGVGFRPELEIKYQTSDLLGTGKYETLNFIYKMKDNNSLRVNLPHQPRIDWQIWFSALSDDINTEPWLIIMLGKVLEKNPVILDLLGYRVNEKIIYYKSNISVKLASLFERIIITLYGNRPIMSKTPLYIKVEQYKYYFTKDYEKLWKKVYVQDLLPKVDKNVLVGIFKAYGLPEINEERYIHVSKFQDLPIIDIVLFVLLMKFMLRLFNKN
jgi:hypothetical protein